MSGSTVTASSAGPPAMRSAAAPQFAGRRRPSPARGLLVLAMIVWAWIFGVHVVWRQARFGTPDQDLGIWDQAVWLLAHGRSFVTVRGLPVFGFHASPAIYLYVPFYWLGAGPHLLNLSMVGMLCFGAVAVYRLARHYLANDWQALVLALAFLVNFAGQWMLLETFHPEVMAVTPLLFAYLASVEGRWRAFAGWLVFALLWKEDVALVGAMVGFVMMVRGTRTITGRSGPTETRKAGAWAMGLCLLWFVIATQLLIPVFSGHGNFTEGLYGDLGATPAEIAVTAVTDPGVVIEHLQESEPQRYIFELTGSYGFTPLTAPLVLLTALPQALINLLAIYNFFWTTKVHYAAIPLFAVSVAAVEGVARWRRPRVRGVLLAMVAFGAVYTAVNWGISPASPKYRAGFWPLTPSPQQEALDAAAAVPEADDVVSSMWNMVPHLSHRPKIYTFPNPWIADNWGVKGENRPDPNEVDWIILNPSTLDATHAGTLVVALTDPGRLINRGEQPPPPVPPDFARLADPSKWEVRVNRPDLLIVHRIRGPGR